MILASIFILSSSLFTPAPGVMDSIHGIGLAQLSAEQPSFGKMDFEAFRLITTGMTQAEVLSRAGKPFHTEFLGCGHSVPVPWCPVGCVFCQTRWDYLGDGYSEDWIFEVKFLGDRVFETNNYRRTP
jgi:hypothetical protein